MVQLEIAERLRARRQPHLRRPQRGRPARLRGRTGPQGRPRRLQAAPRVDSAICGCGAPARRRRGDPRPDPRRLRPPPQNARPLARDRRMRGVPAARRRPRRFGELACPRTPVPRALARRFRRALGEPPSREPDRRPAPMLVHAPAKLNLGLYLGAPAPTDCTSSARCSSRSPSPISLRSTGPSATRFSAPGVEGENLAARALAVLRGAAGPAAAADRDREADPGRRGPRRRLSRCGGDPAASPPGRSTELPGTRARANSVPTSLRSCAPRSPWSRGAGERVEPLPGPCRARGAAAAGWRRALDRGGLRRGRPARAWPRAGRARGDRRAPARPRPGRAPRRSPTPTSWSTTSSPPARSLRPDIGDALEALSRGRRARRPSSAARAYRGRALRQPRRGRVAPARPSTATTQSSAGAGGSVNLPGTANASANGPPRRDRRRGDRDRLLPLHPGRQPRPGEPAGGRRQRARRLDLPLVGFFAFAETGAFIGLVAPGETVMLLGGAVAGQGAINLYVLIAIAWTAPAPATSPATSSAAASAASSCSSTVPASASATSASSRSRTSSPPRRQNDLHRPLRRPSSRAFAPFIAGNSGMRFRQFIPYSVLGCGIWVSATVVSATSSRARSHRDQVRRQRRLVSSAR